MVRYVLLFILLLLIARMFWKVVDAAIIAAGGGTRARGGRAPERSVKLVRDPVCGTHVAPNAALSISDGSGMHYFCSPECRAEYSRRPAAGGRR